MGMSARLQGRFPTLNVARPSQTIYLLPKKHALVWGDIDRQRLARQVVRGNTEHTRRDLIDEPDHTVEIGYDIAIGGKLEQLLITLLFCAGSILCLCQRL